jgi:hypothetical protein
LFLLFSRCYCFLISFFHFLLPIFTFSYYHSFPFLS